ncbi:MAG: redoxin family protein [Acidobacteriota bacterium]
MKKLRSAFARPTPSAPSPLAAAHRWILVAALLGLVSVGMVMANELPERLTAPQQVEAISAQEFEQLLEHHKGDVILVNLWATWCIPCIQELPDLSLLQERYRDRGLRIIAVSLDDPEKLEDKVRPFFAKRAPELVSYLQTEDDQYDFVEVLSDEWFGALPTSFLISREGEVVLSQSGRMLYAELEKEVLSELDPKGP